MQCPRCLNTDEVYFYLGSKGWMCRRCVSFQRQLLEEELKEADEVEEIKEAQYHLDYILTPAQKEAALTHKKAIRDRDVLLYAVCGAGKTEMLMEMMEDSLRKGKRIVYAVPRRQVVLEIAARLSRAFPQVSVIPVCQGYTEKTEADLVVCTTHQLYRYRDLDFLILDEPDAFPFKGNRILQGIASSGVRGHTVYLTATPDQSLKQAVKEEKMQEIRVMRRPHGHDLTIPVIKTGFSFWLIGQLLYWLFEKKKQTIPVLVFVPTIRLARQLEWVLKPFFVCDSLSSKTENKEEKIDKFRKHKTTVLIATTVLERGVTIPGVDVCVFFADHPVFDEASLIQMLGRIGRSMDCPTGEGLLLARSRSYPIVQAAAALKEANVS